MAAQAEMPSNWQEVVQSTMKKAVQDDPTRAVFGLVFPDSWKPELMSYVRNGEVGRLFGVKAISFGGSKVTVTYPPDKKEEAKAQKKAG